MVNLWDPSRPEAPLATLSRSDPDETTPTHPLVAISPDGKTVATAWFHKLSVSFWSAETGEDLGAIETSGELTALGLGPDNQLATAGGGEVRLWDTASRTALPSLTPGQSEVRLLRFSPAGSLLAVAGLFGRDVELWDTAAHSLVAVLPTSDPVEDVSFSPDGRTLAAATQGEKAPVWAVIEPDVRARIAGFDAVSRSLAFRGDGLLAMGVWKGAIRFRDAGRNVQAGPPADADPARDRDRERPTAMAFDDLGALVTLEPDALRVWPDPPRSPVDGFRIAIPHRPGGGGLLARSPDGRTLAVASYASIFLRHSADPKALVAVKLPAALASRARDFRFIRDRGPGPGPGPGPDPNRGRFGPPLSWRALAVAPAGDRLYLIESGPPDGSVLQAWALDADAGGTQARLLTWPGLPADATALALSPDGTTLALGLHSGGVVLIDTASGSLHDRLIPPTVSEGEGEGDGQVASLAFAPDGATLAVGTQQGSITLWSLSTVPAPLFRLPAHRGQVVASLAFDPLGHSLASSGGDKTVDVWDLRRIRQEFDKLGLAW